MSFLPSSGSSSSLPNTQDVAGVVAAGGDASGSANSRDAIRAALATAWAARQSTGRRQSVYFGPGRFKVTSKDGLRAIDIAGMNGITFIGEPGRTTISFEGDAGAGDWYLFEVRNGSYDIEFRGIAMDMSGLTNPDPAEQNHLLQISYTANDVRAVDCTFMNTIGDGIRLFGEFGSPVADIKIDRCRFLDCGRAGVVVSRWVRYASITGCYFEGGTDQQIDFEPTGAELVADAGSTATVIVDAAASFLAWQTAGQIEVGDPVYNVIDGVMAWIVSIDSATQITVSSSAVASWATDSYTFPRHCSGHLVAHNVFRRNFLPPYVGSSIAVTLTNAYDVIFSHNVVDGCIQAEDMIDSSIIGNRILTPRDAEGTAAIQMIKDCRGVVVANNSITVRGSSHASGRSAIAAVRQIRAPRSISVRGNRIRQEVRSSAVRFENCLSGEIKDNSITLATPGDTNQSIAVNVVANVAGVTVDHVDVAGNMIDSASSDTWLYAYQVSASSTATYRSARFGGGMARKCNSVFQFASAVGSFISPPVVDMPSVDQSNANVLVPIANLKWFQVGGIGGFAAAAGVPYRPGVYWGDDTPEGVLTAGVGSIAMRRNGGAATSIYVKESGTGNTGWVAK